MATVGLAERLTSGRPARPIRPVMGHSLSVYRKRPSLFGGVDQWHYRSRAPTTFDSISTVCRRNRRTIQGSSHWANSFPGKFSLRMRQRLTSKGGKLPPLRAARPPIQILSWQRGSSSSRSCSEAARTPACITRPRPAMTRIQVNSTHTANCFACSPRHSRHSWTTSAVISLTSASSYWPSRESCPPRRQR